MDDQCALIQVIAGRVFGHDDLIIMWMTQQARIWINWGLGLLRSCDVSLESSMVPILVYT